MRYTLLNVVGYVRASGLRSVHRTRYWILPFRIVSILTHLNHTNPARARIKCMCFCVSSTRDWTGLMLSERVLLSIRLRAQRKARGECDLDAPHSTHTHTHRYLRCGVRANTGLCGDRHTFLRAGCFRAPSSSHSYVRRVPVQ